MNARILRSMIGGLALSCCAAAAAPLVVHEWGTFTSFQDERGQTISGINVDDEPVPGFVHRLGDVQIFNASSLPARWFQGAPACHPDVTLRLETPVVYFYPPAGRKDAPFDVQATFKGGWLTEYFPRAATERAGFPGPLDANAQGSLRWRGLRLDPAASPAMPKTDSHVWLAPRQVDASVVAAEGGAEAEKYLFYRGVGHLDSPVVVRQADGAFEIALRQPNSLLRALPRLWLVEVAPGGDVHYQTVDATGPSARAPAFGPASARTKTGLAALQRELSAALTASGLYEKEAAAMLDTWRLSYFESEGLRAFFLLPQAWTDAQLPLSLSAEADVTRVMVGRVELVSGRQRAVLDEMLAVPDPDFPQMPLYAEDRRAHELMREGGRSQAELYREVGRDVPRILQLYVSLGRFRDALLAHELRTADSTRRARLERITRNFSVCDVKLRPAGADSANLTTQEPVSAARE